MPNIDLLPPLAGALVPLLNALPMDTAMTALVVKEGPGATTVALVERVLNDPVLAGNDALAAGLWLYVDDLDRSHKISQQHEEDPTFCFWHAIMHRREGDFSNSGHWFRRAGKHPAMPRITIAAEADYEPYSLLKRVEAAVEHGEAPPELIEMQRCEWLTLFGWCAEQ